jgi:hypothetical protein
MTALAMTVAAALPGSLRAQNYDLTWLYPHVDSLIQYPTPERYLTILCQKKVENKYISFVGTTKTGDKVLLAVVTLSPLTDVTHSLSLYVDFGPHATPSPGKISTWAYVFDRNHDGKIDFLSLLAGAGPVKRDDMPDNYPKRGQPLSRPNLEFFVGHCSLVFDHWADDNFDDTLDAVIHHDMDPERDWVQRQIVIRSTNFDGKFDSVSTFRRQPGDLPNDTIAYSSGWVPFYPIGKIEPDAITQKSFLEKTELLRLLNRAVKACRLGPDRFYPLRPEG